MAKIEYFPCYNSYLSKTAKLTDEELGRLFRALMAYSASGERPELDGREELAFDFIADDIDRAQISYAERCEANTKNGKRGGRPKQIETDGFSGKPKKANGFLETEKSQNKDKDEDKDKYETKTKRNGEESACAREDDDEDVRALIVAKEALNACADAWRASSGSIAPADYDTIDALVAEYGTEDLTAAIQAAHENGAGGKWAYVRKVLANWRQYGKEKRQGSARSRDKPVGSGDVMLRHSAEDRNAAWSAALIDFDREDA